ncbi:MAG TPA: Flp pilus assembly protein CpaB [Caulobacteraceae bacterium]|jgi:pilus assembly protein CpaB
MGALRLVIVLVVAGAAAITLALGFRQLTASHSNRAMAATPVVQSRPQIRVLVARHDLRVGSRLTPDDVKWQPWPANAANPAFISGGPVKDSLVDKAEAALSTDPAVQSVTGALVRTSMVANEPMNLNKIVKAGQSGFMAVKLQAGMRAMATAVNVDTGVAGFILPGDHVDVIQNIRLTPASDGMPNVQSRILLKNIRVLAIDQAPDPKPGASSLVGTTATLEIPEDNINILAKGRDEGSLQLALRSYADLDDPVGAPKAPPPIHRALRYETVAVHVYRGARETEVRVP